MEYGWLTLILVVENGISIYETKSKQEEDKLDNEGSEANAKTLYCIFNGVSDDEFSRITCKYAKED